MGDHTPGPWRAIEVCVEHMDTQVAREALAAVRAERAALLAALERLEHLAENGYPTRSVSFEMVRHERRAAIAQAKENADDSNG